MGTRILEAGETTFVDTVTDTSFGPVMPRDEMIRFQEWLGKNYPDGNLTDSLENLYENDFWCEEHPEDCAEKYPDSSANIPTQTANPEPIDKPDQVMGQ